MTDKTISNLGELRQERERIVALARQFHVRQISVFGSIVRGELLADSDVDFLVGFERDYKLRDQIRLTQALQRLLGRRVEVVDRHSLREELRGDILREALTL